MHRAAGLLVKELLPLDQCLSDRLLERVLEADVDLEDVIRQGDDARERHHEGQHESQGLFHSEYLPFFF